MTDIIRRNQAFQSKTDLNPQTVFRQKHEAKCAQSRGSIRRVTTLSTALGTTGQNARQHLWAFHPRREAHILEKYFFLVTLHCSKYDRLLTFDNVWQAWARPTRSGQERRNRGASCRRELPVHHLDPEQFPPALHHAPKRPVAKHLCHRPVGRYVKAFLPS